MRKRAESLGGHAIVGVDIDYEVLGQAGNMLMVTVSGTGDSRVKYNKDNA